MWKKRLIAIVTFLAGLYFFFEFIIPSSVPWHTTRGVLLSKTDKQVTIGLVENTENTPVSGNTLITRIYRDLESNQVIVSQLAPGASDSLRPGDFIRVQTQSGKEISGIVTPDSSSRWLQLGKVTKTVTVDIKKKTLVKSVRSKGSGQPIALNELRPSNDASASVSTEWVEVGPNTYLTTYLPNVNEYLNILGAMAWGMGLLSLWLVHSGNIRKRRPEWGLSVVFFLAVIGGILAGIGYGSPGKGWEWTLQVNDVVVWKMMRPMGSTVFSLLTFYLASAAYRSFKAKSKEAVLMMVSALIVMLGQISLYIWFTSASTWILYIINTAAVRGMMFGMMLGAIAVGLRMWLSLERGAFFDREL
jgi:hypothetical protein